MMMLTQVVWHGSSLLVSNTKQMVVCVIHDIVDTACKEDWQPNMVSPSLKDLQQAVRH